MNIYSDYINNIESAMGAGSKAKMFSESRDSFDGYLQKGLTMENSYQRLKGESLLPSLKGFATNLSLNADFDQQLGLHPDFAHLKGTTNTENHYIASVFIDIKGSTNLFRRYTPETVLIINDTIQKAAIHTCLIFDGYVHRLQGDGLFVYYGGKSISKDKAVNQALLSTSVFSYFVKNDLKRVFDQQGVDNISTRIGIDLGHNKDVLWFDAGIGKISEITTCSLHTSLAPKMQSNAETNGIVIGDHVKDQVASSYQDLITPVCKRTDNVNDRYIFQIPDENFRYTQYDFNWMKFLKRQEFIATDFEDRLTFKNPKEKQIRISEDIKPFAIQSTPYLNF